MCWKRYKTISDNTDKVVSSRNDDKLRLQSSSQSWGLETPNSVIRFDKQIYGSDVSSETQNLDNPLRISVFAVANFLRDPLPNSFL